MIKLVATDIDGTILIPEGEFTQGVKDCIKKLNDIGIMVVLVTGRMNAAATKIAASLGLETPVISYQGGLITLKNEILYEKYLTLTQCNSILDWAKEEKIHINLYNNDILYSENENYEIKRYCNNLHTEYKIKNFDDVEKNKINKLLAIDYNNPERISNLEQSLKEVFPDIYIVKSTPYFLEFSNPEASKYHAVKFLQKYYNISESETLSIGDQNNDIALLQAGGLKIAMGNASDELKSISDEIADTVYNDGFVKIMEKYCF